MFLSCFKNCYSGKFPREFIEVIVDVHPSMKFIDKSEPNEDQETVVPHAKAIHMFIGENTNELSFDKGDIITLHSRFNKDWMRGKIGNSIGLFPLNHVKILVDLPLVVQTTTPTAGTATNNGISNVNNNVKRTAPSVPQFPHKKVNTSPVTNQHNQETNGFPIPPTVYPPAKENNSPTSPTPPEIKRRVNKPKNNGTKKRSIDAIDYGMEFDATPPPPVVVVKPPPPLKEKPAVLSSKPVLKKGGR